MRNEFNFIVENLVLWARSETIGSACKRFKEGWSNDANASGI
jgi:hypothetical protein